MSSHPRPAPAATARGGSPSVATAGTAGAPGWQAPPVAAVQEDGGRRLGPVLAPSAGRARWRALDDVDRFDVSTRASLYLLGLLGPFLVLVTLAPVGSTNQLVVAGMLSLAHAAACTALVHAGVEHYLARRARPRRHLAVAVALGGALAAYGVVGLGGLEAPAEGWTPLSAAVVAAAALTAGAAATAVRAGVVLLVAAAVAGAWVVGSLVLGGPATGRTVVPTAVSALCGVVAAALSFRFSAWYLGVMAQLRDAQAARAALAVAEERLRFSRDLHDVVGRALSAVAVKSELAAELARRGDEPSVRRAAEQSVEVRALAQEALRESRALARGYRDVDLAAELDGARSLLRSAGITCTTAGDELPGTRGWPVPVRTALGWGVREGVTNVLRHSRSRTCSVRLLDEEGDAVLVVDDDGRDDGARPPGTPVPTGGAGLVGLAERVRPLGGRVDAGRLPGGGFRLAVRVPTAPPSDGAPVVGAPVVGAPS